MAGRKKGGGGKCRGERVQVHATFTFQQAEPVPQGGAAKKEAAASGTEPNPTEEKERGDRDRGAKVTPGAKLMANERLSFAEHAIKILDHMMKERSVGELLKLGPREEMLGLTPLSMAAAVGHVEGTRKLLEAGAAVDDKSSDGSTALLNAAHWRHLPVLDLLLQHGGNVAAINNEGNNALMIALRHGDVRAVNSLWPHRKNLDINHANNDGYTAIHLAAERKWESCVQFLIQNGADVNKQNNSGQTALHIAASKGDHPTAERLLTAGASLLLEDHCGNNPFCLAVRGFHDFLAGYLLSKLKTEDKLYFCKRRVHKLQSQLTTESCSAWNAVSFLTSDTSLRDALYQCDVMRVAVQALSRRGVVSEAAVQSCLVCSDLMYNPFPLPDLRFVKQFLSVHGPEAILDRLDSRGGQEHLHALDCKELSHLQGQLQNRQQQMDFNTAFILLPIMAMAETPAGRDWFTEANNQQRIATHLRRVTSYRELLQLVGVVQQEMCGREVKVDRVAVMERFIAFFNTMENQDREEKVRQLLEQEEREKSRKEKKREKKRQQRLKQKLKTKASDSTEESTSKEGGGGSEATKAKSQPLDALDDIPLTVGPDGVQDVSNPAAAAVLPLGVGQDAQGSEDEWVMVGGKRCYPSKTRASLPAYREENTRDQDPFRTSGEVQRTPSSSVDPVPNSLSDDTTTSTSLPNNMQTAAVNDCGSLDISGPSKQPMASDANCKVHKGGKRWADVARNGNPCLYPEDSGLSISSPTDPELESSAPAEEKKPTTQVTHIKKEVYHEQFPSLGQQMPTDDPSGQPTSLSNAQRGNYGIEMLGAAHQFLEKLCSSRGGFVGRLPEMAGSSGQASCPSQTFPNMPLEPSVFYEALTGWMWQAAVAKGLITPDVDHPPRFSTGDFLAPLTNHFLKPKPSGENKHNYNEILATAPESESKSSSVTKLADLVTKSSTQKKQVSASNTPPSAVKSIKDLIDMAKPEPSNILAQGHPLLISERLTDNVLSVNKMCRNPAEAPGLAATCGTSSHTLASSACSADGVALTKNKTEPETTHVRANEEDPFLWTGSDFSHWLPSHSTPSGTDSTFSNRVIGKPVKDSNGPYGLPCLPSLDKSNALDFLLPKSQQQQQPVQTVLTQKGASGNRRLLTLKENSEEKYQNYKAFESGADNSKQFPMFDSVAGRERAVSNSDNTWLCENPAKARIKTAVVSVPHSPDSDSTRSSPTEHRSEMVSEDVFSVISDTSRSSCLNNDSFHQLSPSNSTASSLTGLHECLAPGFLRAAVGDPHKRSFGISEDISCSQEGRPSPLDPVLSNMGLLPSATGMIEGDVQRRVDNQYPDLSTVPEREQSLSFPTHLPKALRVVGQGRPVRSDGTRLNSSNYTPLSPSVSNPKQTSVTDDGASSSSSSTPAASTSTTAASSFLTTLSGFTLTKPVHTPERPDSPHVLFPESLRDDEGEGQPKPVDVFPSIHDMNERDLFQDVFSNSYFLEQIAIDQIRRRLQAMGGGDEILKTSSVLFHDLDYYASLYGVRLRDILGPSVEAKPTKPEKFVPKRVLDQSVPAWKAVVKELGRRMNSKEDLRETGDLELPMVWDDGSSSEWPWSCKVAAPQIVTGGDTEGDEGWWQEGGGSRRWRKWLRQILDMPWTMRRQFGKIVLPARSMEFNIGRTGRHPLILGFLTDGTEVGVLALDRTRQALDTRLMATVAADSEPDVHFVLRYKAVWECTGRVYLAMELCDYTLDEYVGIVRLDHRQDPLSANRLAWQLLKGLKYLHSNFAVPHGNLMPGWIFVDCDGRLRLAGYGVRDITSPTRSGSQDHSERCSIEGDCRYWRATDHVPGTPAEPSFQADIQVAGMLLHYTLTGGRHPYGDTGPEVEANLARNNIRQQRVSHEADHLVSVMTVSDPTARPSIDACLKHPFFWSGEKRFRLVLIVGSDILTEMKTGVPLTGAGSTSMVDILNVVHISTLGEVDPVLMKEMRAFRQYKNNLPELVLFVYNCCLHYDKMSTVAKEVLDDPCKYFQSRFTGLFMAVYRAMRASDRTDRTCYKPFF